MKNNWCDATSEFFSSNCCYKCTFLQENIGIKHLHMTEVNILTLKPQCIGVKDGLISERFSFCLKSPKKGYQITLLWIELRIVIWFLKLFWPPVRKNCLSDREKLLKNWGWRPRIFQIFWGHLNNLFEQWMVRTTF